MIKVLHIVSSLRLGGGVQQLLINYQKHLNRDQIRFDYVVHGESVGGLEEKVKEFGSNVYHVTPKRISLYRNFKEINNVIRHGNYDIVHCHQDLSNFSSLFLAKAHSVPVRISHAHSNFTSKSKLTNMRNAMARKANKVFANYFFACSLESGRWLHGNKWSPNGYNILFKNAIDVERFSFNEQSRLEYRRNLGLTDKTVLLHVGRFSEEKNHIFMIEILERILATDDKYVLMFVGSGTKELNIRDAVKDSEITKHVKFLGARDDIPELMNASDIFLLPSKHEGFGMTAVEAQVSGLTTLVSDRVPSDTKVSDRIKYLPIDSPSVWEEMILKTNLETRQSQIALAERAGYSISSQAQNYEKWLYTTVDRNRK